MTNPDPGVRRVAAGPCLATFTALVVAVGIGLSMPLAAQQPSASGTLTANGETIELPYVYVHPVDGYMEDSDPAWQITFAAEPIAERDLDDFFHDFAYVKVRIHPPDPDTGEEGYGVFAQDIRFSKLDSNISGGSYPVLELTETGPERFAGRIHLPEPHEFFDDTFQYDLTFSATLSDPNAPIGDLLPAGGGDPGKAYTEWVAAVHSGEVERILKILPPEMKGMLEEEIAGKSDEEIAETLEMLTLFTPPSVEVVGGSSDGETAILEVSGEMDGQAVTGEITMKLNGGRWVVAGESWR